MLRTTLVAAALLLTAAPAFASADLPDGTYKCTLDGADFGYVKVAGDSYSTSNDGAAFDTEAMFIVLDGKVQFLGSVAFAESLGYAVDSTPVRPGASGALGFDLVVLTPDQSGFVTAACDVA